MVTQPNGGSRKSDDNFSEPGEKAFQEDNELAKAGDNVVPILDVEDALEEDFPERPIGFARKVDSSVEEAKGSL